MAPETHLRIEELTAFHLVLDDQPGYWEDDRGGGAGSRDRADTHSAGGGAGSRDRPEGSSAGGGSGSKNGPDTPSAGGGAGSKNGPDTPSAGGGAAFLQGRLEFRPGWQTVYPTTIETVLLRVRLDDGSIGWGEANTPIGPEVTALICERLLAPMAAGRRFPAPQALWDFLYDAQRGRGYAAGFYLDAMAALDIAVWDAVGRRAGLPVAALLSEQPRPWLPVYLSGLRQATLAQRIATLQRWRDTGLRGIKIFVDGDPEAGARELRALQDAAGGGIEQWMVDTLWMCRGEDAPRAKAIFGDLGARWLECPLQPEDLHGHRALVRRRGAPIALGEHFRTHYQTAVWFETPAALDIFQPDVGRTGLSDGLRQVEQARAAGIPSTPHMGNGLHLFQAATLHFATACGDAHLQEYQAGLAARADLIGTSAWRYAGGGFTLPDAPGLGVEIDEQALARYVAPDRRG